MKNHLEREIGPEIFFSENAIFFETTSFGISLVIPVGCPTFLMGQF